MKSYYLNVRTPAQIIDSHPFVVSPGRACLESFLKSE